MDEKRGKLRRALNSHFDGRRNATMQLFQRGKDARPYSFEIA